MEQWKLAFVLSRRRYREKQLKEILRTREDRFKRLYLARWLNRIENFNKKKMMADEILDIKTEMLSKELFVQWLGWNRRNSINLGVAEKLMKNQHFILASQSIDLDIFAVKILSLKVMSFNRILQH